MGAEARVTELLFYQDAYLREFEARVVAVGPEGIELDRTAFYPGGGGQPCDVGHVSIQGTTVTVSGVKRIEGRIWHRLEGEAPAPGEPIQASLDWERRLALMRTHTAMHVLCGVVWRDYGASVTGGNMELLQGRMDFEFERMQQELVHEIEARIQAEVEAARPVRTRSLPRAEAFEIPDLIRTKINLLPAGIQDVRVVEIVGLDLQADGGTHVSDTGQVGRIRIVDYKSKGAINKRLVVALDR
jgi:misacylated tRNA(Ala) deacylase